MTTAQRPYQVVGTRPVRPDGMEKVTGRAGYSADTRLPGMLYGRLKRSPHGHAYIRSIDTSKAEALPGVRAVITAADFPGDREEMIRTMRGHTTRKWFQDMIMASDKVLHYGHAVAAVCATDPHIAEDALDLIEVEYEPLPPVLDVLEAMAEGAPILHEEMRTVTMLGRGMPGAPINDTPSNVVSHMPLEKGDPDQGFADADLVIEREFRTGMAHQGYIEPQSAVADWGPDGMLTVWASSQGAFNFRDQLAVLLQIPAAHIRVVPTEIGGGFGGKLYMYVEPIAALFSQRTGKPVKVSLSREEVLTATGPTSGTYVRVKIGAKRDGTLLAGEAELAYEAGSHPPSPVGGGCMTVFGPYDIPNLRVDGYDVVVNKPKVSSYRAPGACQPTLAVESVLDEIAEELAIEPMELRLRNAAREGTRILDGRAFPTIGAVDVMETLRTSEHYRSELSGEYQGRGVAIGYWYNGGGEGTATASINAGGTVSLIVGSVDIGGQRASLAMQMAEALGIPYEDVRPHVVDTESIGYTGLTAGSATTFKTGWAVYKLAQELQTKLQARAARIWDVSSEQVEYRPDATIHGPPDEDGNARSFTFRELASQLPGTGGNIAAQADSNETTWGPSFAGHIVDVEVDPATGKVDILRYTAVQDVGTAIHPSYVEGQMQGGASQGAGMALSEEYIYDEDGRLRNASLLDYRMPTTVDLPMVETVLVEVPNPGHPYGVRGVGEVPIVPPLGAIANALHDATGVRMRHLPLNPERVLEALGEI